jgi:outer membrane protein assembly factor BamB
VYIGSWDGYEYALDQATGAVKWKTFLGQTTTPSGFAPCNPPYSDTEGVNSSPTILNGVAYLSGGDSYFYALDTTTGNVLWKVFLANTVGTGYENFSSPVVANGFAYVGLASNGDCPLTQGAVLQIDLTAHQIANRFNVVAGVGGGIWSSPAYDAATNTLYVTTGNDNNNDQYTDSLIALNASNLSVERSWMIPASGNFGDADYGASPTLFTDSTGRTLVGAPNKDGYFYALDRSTFQLVWSYQFGDQACGNPPSGCGSISSAAFANGVIYVAGGHTTINGTSCAGSLRALNPDNGNRIWQSCEQGVVMGAVAYANGIVVVGAANILEVHDAGTGALLYSYQESTDGDVYLSASPTIANGQILEGYGGDPAAGGTLFAFGLSGVPTSTPTPTGTPGTPSPTTTLGSATATATPSATATPTNTGTVPLAPAYVQGNYAVPQSSQSAVTVSYPGSQAVGDLNVVAVGWNDTSATVASVADSAGNSYQLAVPLARANGLSQAIYYAKNIAASPNDRVTVTFNQAASFPDVRVMEYANVDTASPFDAGATGSGTAATASSGGATTTAASELLVGAGMTQGAFGGAGAGYTKRIITSPDGDIAEDRVVAATGSYSATAPENGAWLMQLATFRAATSP